MRLVAILFTVGVWLGASTLQQVIDIQPDRLTDDAGARSSVDDIARPDPVELIRVSPRQGGVVAWISLPPNDRMHTLFVFRPPRVTAFR